MVRCLGHSSVFPCATTTSALTSSRTARAHSAAEVKRQAHFGVYRNNLGMFCGQPWSSLCKREFREFLARRKLGTLALMVVLGRINNLEKRNYCVAGNRTRRWQTTASDSGFCAMAGQEDDLKKAM